MWLEVDLGKTVENTQDLVLSNKLLLTRSVGFIRDERACLSIDEETQHYNLHQRILLAHITPQAFQKAIEQFGGCLCYVSDLNQAEYERSIICYKRCSGVMLLLLIPSMVK